MSNEELLSAPELAKPRMAAGVLIRDASGAVLMVRPTYKDGWDIPGGYVEPGESPAAAAAREIREELGIDRHVGRLLVVDWAPHPAEGDKVLWIFDGGVMDHSQLTELVLQSEEIAEVDFVAEDGLDALTVARLARRLHLGADAARSGSTHYAEMGCAAPGR